MSSSRASWPTRSRDDDADLICEFTIRDGRLLDLRVPETVTDMASLIAYGIVLAGIAVSLWGAYAHVKGIGADAQKAADAPIIAAASKRADDAETANLSLTKDLGLLKDACAVSERAVDEFRRQQDAAREASRKVLAQITATEGRVTQRIASLATIRDTPPAGGSDCANTETDRILRDGARERLRDPAAPRP